MTLTTVDIVRSLDKAGLWIVCFNRRRVRSKDLTDFIAHQVNNGLEVELFRQCLARMR